MATSGSRAGGRPCRTGAGRDAGESLDGVDRGIPVFATIADALLKLGQTPDFCVLGVPPSGRGVTPGLRALPFESLHAGTSAVRSRPR